MCLLSIAAIGIATFPILKNQSANITLREQARLLDLTHDAIFARDTNDVIAYWNRGAMELYRPGQGTIFRAQFRSLELPR
jgi:two-component system sensor kinase FixL